MKNLNENGERIFLVEEAAHNFFSTICATDRWVNCFTKELTATPIDNAPILMDEIRTKLNIDPIVSDESMVECMESYNLGISLPNNNKLYCYPLGSTAFGTLIQRAGYQNSPVLSLLTDKQHQKAMSPLNKSEVLNMGLQCFNNKVLVLIRDEKIRAVLSGDEADYTIFSYEQLFKIFKEGLKTQFNNVIFSFASASHEYFTSIFEIKDINVNKEIADAFSKCHIDVSDMTLACKLVSSDVGISGANIYPYIQGKGREMMIGLPLVLTHKNKHSLVDFTDNVNKILSLFKDAENKIAHMQNQKIKNPGGCLRRIAKQVGLPKKITCETAPVFEGTYGYNAYQCDVFWCLYDIFDKYVNETDASEARKLTLQEGIARIAFGNMSDYDMPYEWE